MCQNSLFQTYTFTVQTYTLLLTSPSPACASHNTSGSHPYTKPLDDEATCGKALSAVLNLHPTPSKYLSSHLISSSASASPQKTQHAAAVAQGCNSWDAVWRKSDAEDWGNVRPVSCQRNWCFYWVDLTHKAARNFLHGLAEVLLPSSWGYWWLSGHEK